MSQSKCEINWATMEWTELGSGTYNVAYLSSDKEYVLKIQRAKDDVSDKPERSVRLWNQINPGLPAFVVEKTKMGKGWICPFIRGVAATDQQTSDCIIDIFNSTGRIVADGPAFTSKMTTNFISTPAKKVICIDVGLALQMEAREKVIYKSQLAKNSQLIREKSVVSLDVWKELASEFPAFFQTAKCHRPKTTRTIKALLFIKAERPDIVNADFLKKSPDLRMQLGEAYHGNNIDRALATLDRHIPSISPYKSITDSSLEEKKEQKETPSCVPT